MRTAAGVAAGALLVWTGIAAGQEQPKPAQPADEKSPLTTQPRPDAPKIETQITHDWTLQVEPSVWYVGLSGRGRMPGSPAGTPKFDISDLNADSPRASPYVDAELALGNYRLSFSGAGFESDRNAIAAVAGQIGAVAVAPGDVLATSLSFATAEAKLGYVVLEKQLRQRPDETYALRPEVTVFGGARLHWMDLEVAAPGGTASADDVFVEPIVGAKLSMEIVQDFTIDLETSFGWWPDSAASWDIVAGFTWRPVKRLGIQVGYRNTWFDLKSGYGASRFEYEGAAAGLFAGLQLRF